MPALARQTVEPPSGDAATLAAPSFEAAQAQLTAAWDVRGIDVASLQYRRGTVVGATVGVPPSQRAATLPSLLTVGPHGAEPQFQIGDVLGEGGMGVVRVAKQLALRREVAVKTLKPVAGDSEATQLLREARVTGVLEHPNVVPVYALGLDNDARPLLVMKRISGESWGAQLDAAEADDRLTDAYLRKHLAVLKQVALAVHYAHAKGIIHRDLKPDNVMIGDFGEVYLVDWGIAVSLRDDADGVPSVRDITAIEGTPGYMAPEMAAADGAHIDERSDVYLLGAILHQIITGDVPHTGKSIVDILTAAFVSELPTYPPAVPRDLAAICHRAMARFSEDRYPSAAAFAEALDEFVVHRSSTLLSDEASAHLAEARALMAANEDDPVQLYAKFSECRFAFTQALRSWPENQAATAGLQQTLELMIEHELARDAPQAAHALLSSLPGESPALAARVEAALEEKRLQGARLAELERDADINVGASTRKMIGMMLASSWGVAGVVFGMLTRAGVVRAPHFTFAVLAFAFAGAALVSAVLRRKRILTTALNRRLTICTVLVFVGYAALWVQGGIAGVALHEMCAFQALLGAVVWTIAGLTTVKTWALIAVGDAIAWLLLFVIPEYPFEIVGVLGGASAMLVAYLTSSPTAGDGSAASSP